MLSICIIVSCVVTARPAAGITIISQSANTYITLGYTGQLEFENPLSGTETVQGYVMIEWRDADYASGPWYDDWFVNDPINIDGDVSHIWMRMQGHSIWTSTTVASTIVSIHMDGDDNDGLAQVMVDGAEVARLDMLTPPGPGNALIIVKNLPYAIHTITINDLGWSQGGNDVSTLGAAALTVKPLVEHSKWSQPPVEIDPASEVPTYCGWDEQSHNRLPPIPPKWKIVADDYRCIGSMPVTSIHWWGSFHGWVWPEKQGQLPPVLPEKWWIGFWSNVPAGAEPNYLPYSYPNKLLHSITIPAARVDFNEVGSDEYYSYYPRDICYQYNVDLNSAEVFRQDDFNEMTYDDIYWISIVAEYNVPEAYYPWGWKTRPWSWMDDAVTFTLSFKPGPNYVTDPCQIVPIVDPMWGESVDVAFEFDTDPNYIKWEQLYTGIRHWPHYEDVNSTYNFYEPEKERLVADDWRCLRRTPVTAVVWWGSYIGYGFEACSSGPFMPLPVPPDKFRLKIWTDVPAGGLGGKADVLFLTDTTGSMGGYIDNLKTAFGGILTAIGASLPGVDIEYGVADYRNYTDGGNYQAYGVNLIQPFTSDTDAVQTAIDGLSAGGGLDAPESQLKSMVN
ncbi:MAG: hypothetical protein MUO27_11495, partial [Sedimentisphaerales bacterium]|nr:hypothetical protein [Sedimentisphaerales bacterium]